MPNNMIVSVSILTTRNKAFADAIFTYAKFYVGKENN